MIRKLLVIACALSLPALSNSQNTVPFETSGLAIGDRITDEFAYDKCPVRDRGEPDIKCSKFVQIGSSKVFLMYIFSDHKLASVTLSFDSEAYDDVVKAYTEKFGVAPHRRGEFPVKTPLGARYMNSTATWNTNAGPFTVQKYGTHIGEGFGILESKSLSEMSARKSKQAAAKAAKEL